jgi:hypothetical protein
MCCLEEDQETESIDFVKIKEAMELVFLEEGINQEVIHEYLKHIEKECLGFGSQDERIEHLEVFSERLYFYTYWPKSKIRRIAIANQSDFPDVHSERKNTEDQFLSQITLWWKENGNCANNLINQENYELRISIEDGNEESYRRILIPSNYTIAELYRIISKIFFWSGEQQHKFLIRRKNHSKTITSNYYGMDIEAVLLDGFDMLTEDYFSSLNLDHILPHAFDTEVTVKDIFHWNKECVQNHELEFICSYGSEGVWVPRFYLHRIELINVVISNEKVDPTLLESSGLRPPEVLHGSMEYNKNHKFVCDESCISYHEGTNTYVEITEPRRSLDEMNELLKSKETSLGISYRGLIHNRVYPFYGSMLYRLLGRASEL